MREQRNTHGLTSILNGFFVLISKPSFRRGLRPSDASNCHKRAWNQAQLTPGSFNRHQRTRVTIQSTIVQRAFVRVPPRNRMQSYSVTDRKGLHVINYEIMI